MNVYEILLTYNKPWSAYEIICFSIVFIAALTCAILLTRRQKIRISQAVAGMLLLLFLAIVFASTVFTRMPTQRTYELELFWSWRRIRGGSAIALKEVLLNCLLLFPLGCLLPFVMNRRLSWWKGLLSGLLVSAAIETSQLVLCRGLFELDDMMHNSFGCMAGCVLANAWFRWKDRKEK